MNDGTIAAGVFFIIAAVNAEVKKKKIVKRMWLWKLFRECTKNSILSILDNEHSSSYFSSHQSTEGTPPFTTP